MEIRTEVKFSYRKRKKGREGGREEGKKGREGGREERRREGERKEDKQAEIPSPLIRTVI